MKIFDIENLSISQIGKSIICKKIVKIDSIIFLPNKQYFINNISDWDNSICICDNDMLVGGKWFSYKPHILYPNMLLIYDYFYTQQEIRLLKLNTL